MKIRGLWLLIVNEERHPQIDALDQDNLVPLLRHVSVRV